MEQENNNKYKKRAPNFTSNEVGILITRVLKSAKIVEDKKTDSSTWKIKNVSWEKIAEDFNASNSSKYLKLRSHFQNNSFTQLIFQQPTSFELLMRLEINTTA
ncbi:hypothetical protein ABEB36_014443 [Hypothenemus hampei]|uniref:Regulatory protein zeste n=1 Tax=Hypothenemus hampei TaxID=57062 RepID=A0ABD1E1V4_HYPHA